MSPFRFVLAAAAMLYCHAVNGQSLLIDWQRLYGGTGADYCEDIKPAGSGYILCGYAYENNGNVLNPMQGGSDYWMVRTDSVGNILWENSFGSTANDWATSVVVAGDGYAAAGLIWNNDGQVTNAKGNGDYWVIKTDLSGNLVWQKAYGGSSSEVPKTIITTKDGGYLVSGLTSSTDGDVTGFHGGTGADAWLIKLNDTGGLVWQKTIGGTSSEYFSDIIETTDSGFIGVGFTASEDGDIGMPVNSYTDLWIVRMDKHGNILWQKLYGGNSIEEAVSIERCPDGGYIIGGNTESTDITGFHGGTETDIWVVKIDSGGNLQWERAYGGSNQDKMGRIIPTTNGYAFSGLTMSFDGDVTGAHNMKDGWVVWLDDTGAITGQKNLGGIYDEGFTGIIKRSDSTFIVAGGSQSSNTGNVNVTGHGDADMWLVELGKHPLGIASQVSATDITAYPTPCHDILYIDVPAGHGQEAAIQLYAIDGRHLPVSLNRNADKLSADVSHVPPGIYVLWINGQQWGMVTKQ